MRNIDEEIRQLELEKERLENEKYEQEILAFQAKYPKHLHGLIDCLLGEFGYDIEYVEYILTERVLKTDKRFYVYLGYPYDYETMMDEEELTSAFKETISNACDNSVFDMKTETYHISISELFEIRLKAD